MLLLASCGGGGDGATTLDGPGATTSSFGDDQSPLLICEDPPPAELGLGSAVIATIDAEDTTACFWVDVPAGIESVSFELTGLTADLRMFLAYGFVVNVQYPGLGEFWEAQTDGPADEVVVIDDPKPGRFFVMVGPGEFGAESAFTFTVRTTPETTTKPTGTALPSSDECASPAMSMDLGSSVSSEIAAKDELPLAHEYFCVEVPEGQTSVTIDLTGLTDVLEVLVRRSNDAMIWRNRGSTSADAQVIVENPEPGPYFIDVVAVSSGAASPFTLSVAAP